MIEHHWLLNQKKPIVKRWSCRYYHMGTARLSHWSPEARPWGYFPKTRSKKVRRRSLEVQARSKKVQRWSLEVQARSKKVQRWSSEVQARSKKVQRWSLEVQARSKKVQRRSSEVQTRSKKVQHRGSEVQARSKKVQRKSSEVPGGTSEVGGVLQRYPLQLPKCSKKLFISIYQGFWKWSLTSFRTTVNSTFLFQLLSFIGI